MRLRSRLAALALVAGVAGLPAAAEPADIIVFAAASLAGALDNVAADWRRDSGRGAAISYAASPALARQIEAGAPADLFISADRAWMDYVEKRGLIDKQSRVDLLGNRLVLIAPKASAATATIGPGFPLAALLDGGRLAIADPEAVPAGRYAKAALEKLGVWDGVKGRLAPAADVRAALLLVARGETPLGIVYETDAAVEPAVRVVAGFPEDTHPPIVYPMALSSHARAAAALFARYLEGETARKAFEKQGFTVLARPR